MDEKNCRWTNEKCEECKGWLLHDLVHDIFYCEKCGLVSKRMDFMINTNGLGVDGL